MSPAVPLPQSSAVRAAEYALHSALTTWYAGEMGWGLVERQMVQGRKAIAEFAMRALDAGVEEEVASLLAEDVGEYDVPDERRTAAVRDTLRIVAQGSALDEREASWIFGYYEKALFRDPRPRVFNGVEEPEVPTEGVWIRDGLALVVSTDTQLASLRAVVEMACERNAEPVPRLVSSFLEGDEDAWIEAQLRSVREASRKTPDPRGDVPPAQQQSEPDRPPGEEGQSPWVARAALWNEDRRTIGQAESLSGAFELAQGLWDASARDEDLELVLYLHAPDPYGDEEEWEQAERIRFGRPALTLSQGSLRGKIVTGALKPVSFVVALVTKAGVGHTRPRKRIAERIHTRAARARGGRDLMDLRELPSLGPEPGPREKGLVVFIHGLLSTDVGTFGPLVERVQDAGYIPVGFPHDTTVSINTTARELVTCLHSRAKASNQPVGFLCHSRGGLVGRSAALKLYELDTVWSQRLRACVTFGTPHLGAYLAEAPEELLCVFLAAAAGGGGGFANLADVLVLMGRTQGIQGIEDLQPRVHDGQFLARLQEDEARAKGSLPLLAVGGRYAENDARQWVADHAIATDDHDLVVQLDSSLPAHLDPDLRIETDCDHFHYFEPGPHLERAATWLFDRMRAGPPVETGASFRARLLERFGIGPGSGPGI